MRALLWWTLLLGGGAFGDGVRAYREGRFREALEKFTEAERNAGDDASAELLYDKALAALRAGELLVAEASAGRAADRGGPELAVLCDQPCHHVAHHLQRRHRVVVFYVHNDGVSVQ